MSKIQIWKRITTFAGIALSVPWLYLICQRYKFESESQPVAQIGYCSYAVFNMSKIQIWKRITTVAQIGYCSYPLYLICQRYKFESESQHTVNWPSGNFAVFNMSKIQIWKRITTSDTDFHFSLLLYLICQRYKFESESQLADITRLGFVCCI